jgi:hypothetical protein
MTEAEWLACGDPVPMLNFLQGGIIALVDELPTPESRASMRDFLQGNGRHRKLGLLALDCCNRVKAALTQEGSRRSVEILEQYLEGKAGRRRLEATIWDAVAARNAVDASGTVDRRTTHAQRAAAHVVCVAIANGVAEAIQESSLVLSWLGFPDPNEVKALQSEVIRCLFGNPFRPVTFSPEWRTDTALTLARQMYESPDFGAMPILADALQDAGCEDAAILEHCRGGEPHCRGCWVVDLILGKE